MPPNGPQRDCRIRWNRTLRREFRAGSKRDYCAPIATLVGRSEGFARSNWNRWTISDTRPLPSVPARLGRSRARLPSRTDGVLDRSAVFDRLLKGVLSVWPPGLREVNRAQCLHSAWQFLEHLRIRQRDILEFSQDPDHISPDFPAAIGLWTKLLPTKQPRTPASRSLGAIWTR